MSSNMSNKSVTISLPLKEISNLFIKIQHTLKVFRKILGFIFICEEIVTVFTCTNEQLLAVLVYTFCNQLKMLPDINLYTIEDKTKYN